MNSIVLLNSKIKTLLLSAVCSVTLLSCYMQPQPVDTSAHHNSKLHPQHTYQVAGHYTQRISKENDSSVMVHVDKVGLLNPAKSITFSVSTTQITAHNQPACDYQGTATLMGQDALHGIVYTAPISDLNHVINANQSTSSTEDKSSLDKDKTNNALEDAASQHQSGLLFLRFKDNTLSIDSNNPQILDAVCTGGISLKGDYAAVTQ